MGTLGGPGLGVGVETGQGVPCCSLRTRRKPRWWACPSGLPQAGCPPFPHLAADTGFTGHVAGSPQLLLTETRGPARTGLTRGGRPFWDHGHEGHRTSRSVNTAYIMPSRNSSAEREGRNRADCYCEEEREAMFPELRPRPAQDQVPGASVPE